MTAPTLHRQIVGDIETRILSGEWPPGFRIPFEVDLATQYGCSRMTVNKAMAQLVGSGLVERRRKYGSTVAQPQAQSAVLEIRDIKAEVQSLGLPYAYICVTRIKRRSTAADRMKLGLAASESVVAIACRHMAGNRPFCLEERLIRIAAVPEAADESFETTAPGPWLIGRVPWSDAEHRIHATLADDTVAEGLAVARGTACLTVERRTWSNEATVTHARLIYPGDRYTLIARFSPAG